MKKIFMILNLAIMLMLPLTAFGERISFTTTDFPPYVIVEDGNISGLEVEIVRELCRRLGMEPDIEVFPWKRALLYVKEGTADGVLMPAYTEERAEYMYFTSESPVRERIAIMAKKGSGIKASSLDDIKGKAVGVVIGSSYGKAFDSFEGLKKDSSTGSEMLLKKLAGNRHPLVVCDEIVLKYLARKTGLCEVETVLVLDENPQFIGFSKAPGKKGEDLTEKFSSAIRQMKEDGTLKKIESKYFE